MKPQEGTNRSIDDLRNGAGSFDLSTPDDSSEISEMVTVAGRLLVIKGKGIYEVKLADQVDPKRTNIGVPNTIQRILPFGSEHSWVGAVVSTAHNLLKTAYLPNEIDCDRALALVLDIAQDIAGMYELAEKYREVQEAAIGNFDLKIRTDRSVMVPAIGNVAVRCKEFLQKSDHALRGLFDVAKLFYTNIGSGGWESLKKEVESGPQDIDNFSQFLSNVLPSLHLVRNARNCVEHPRQDQKIEVTDFSVDAGNNLLPPMIEIIHSRTPLARMPVADFIVQVTQNIVEIVELLMVFLCARHVQSISGFPVQVVEIPPDRRKSANVRFGYGFVQGDEITPMS